MARKVKTLTPSLLLPVVPSDLVVPEIDTDAANETEGGILSNAIEGFMSSAGMATLPHNLMNVVTNHPAINLTNGVLGMTLVFYIRSVRAATSSGQSAVVQSDGSLSWIGLINSIPGIVYNIGISAAVVLILMLAGWIFLWIRSSYTEAIKEWHKFSTALIVMFFITAIWYVLLTKVSQTVLGWSILDDSFELPIYNPSNPQTIWEAVPTWMFEVIQITICSFLACCFMVRRTAFYLVNVKKLALPLALKTSVLNVWTLLAFVLNTTVFYSFVYKT
jgi:hypothetical protein